MRRLSLGTDVAGVFGDHLWFVRKYAFSLFFPDSNVVPLWCPCAVLVLLSADDARCAFCGMPRHVPNRGCCAIPQRPVQRFQVSPVCLFCYSILLQYPVAVPTVTPRVLHPHYYGTWYRGLVQPFCGNSNLPTASSTAYCSVARAARSLYIYKLSRCAQAAASQRTCRGSFVDGVRHHMLTRYHDGHAPGSFTTGS